MADRHRPSREDSHSDTTDDSEDEASAPSIDHIYDVAIGSLAHIVYLYSIIDSLRVLQYLLLCTPIYFMIKSFR